MKLNTYIFCRREWCSSTFLCTNQFFEQRKEWKQSSLVWIPNVLWIVQTLKASADFNYTWPRLIWETGYKDHVFCCAQLWPESTGEVSVVPWRIRSSLISYNLSYFPTCSLIQTSNVILTYFVICIYIFQNKRLDRANWGLLQTVTAPIILYWTGAIFT